MRLPTLFFVTITRIAGHLFGDRSVFSRRPVFITGLPSRVYATSYLFLIPMFAAVYFSMPTAFYHATTRYEAIVHADAGNLESMIQKETEDGFRISHKESVIVHNGLYLDVGPRISLIIASLTFSDNTVDFVVFFYPEERNNSQQSVLSGGFVSRSRIPCQIQLSTIPGGSFSSFLPGYSGQPGLGGESLFYLKDYPYYRDVRIIKSNDDRCASFVSDLMPPLLPSVRDSTNTLRSTAITSDKIFDVWREYNGFPSAGWDNAFRMLYFSATTITTLGYGDIVPLSNLARMLVTLEALLGIVLIGLFLNSLFSRREALSPQSDPIIGPPKQAP